MKRDVYDVLLVCAVLVVFAAVQAHCQELPDAPSATHHKLVAPTEWQPTHKHLKFITNHPTRTAILGITGAMVAAFFIKPTPHCHHYEYGHNGVNVPCPVETGK